MTPLLSQSSMPQAVDIIRELRVLVNNYNAALGHAATCVRLRKKSMCAA